MLSKSCSPQNKAPDTDVVPMNTVKVIEDVFRANFVNWDCVRQKMIELGFSYWGGGQNRVILINQKEEIAVAIEKTDDEPEYCTRLDVYALTRLSQLRVEIISET
jgi:hypothetical protein